MSSQANVFAISALDDLRLALLRFDAEAKETVRGTEMEIRRVQDFLAERRAHWQREMRRRQELAAQAAAVLARCQATVHYDPQTGRSYAPDCSSHEQTLRQTRVHLQQAEDELRNVLNWERSLAQAVADYGRQQGRLGVLLAQDLPKATALLERSAAILRSYTFMAPPAAAGVALAAAPAVPAAPPPASDWVEVGIQDVDLAQIDLADTHVHAAADFVKVSYAEMGEGARKLEEVVRPAVAAGAGGDYFTHLDAEKGLVYADGYRRIYDAFYGGDAIRLNKIGDRYEVVNGYHRLHVARDLGLATVPALVVERTPPPK